MSGFEIERQLIHTRFALQWNDTTPIAWEREPFNPPHNEPWVRLSINNGSGRNVNLYDAVDYIGVIYIQVMVPIGMGSASKARKLVDIAVPIFSNFKSLPGIRCKASEVATIGNFNGWYQVNVTTDFIRSA